MLQKFLENLSKNVSDTAENVGKKTETFVEIQKLRNQIRVANNEIADSYQDIGEIVYRRYKAGQETDDEITEICQEILQLKKQIGVYKDEINKFRGETTCSECGAAVPEGAAYCMKCGAQIPVDVTVEAQEDIIDDEKAPEAEKEAEEEPKNEETPEEATAEAAEEPAEEETNAEAAEEPADAE